MKTLIVSLAAAAVSVCASATGPDTTLVATGNPLFRHKYTADPAALVHDGRMYIFAGHDVCPPPHNHYHIDEWLCFSSADLCTWTEHSVPLRASDFAWARGEAWAGQVVERDGRFYWYVTVEHATDRGKSVGVAVADRPEGPYRDARGSALISNSMTSPESGMMWDDIDPTVIVDDDGQAYLIWGNRRCYMVRLAPGMTEIEGEIRTIDLLSYTEAPWIHKHDGHYYLSYAAEFPEKIFYAMSASIDGLWEFKGVLNELAGNCNTNHQAIVEFGGNWYFIYHNGGADVNGGSFRRSVCIDRLTYEPDGSIRPIRMTSEGIW